MASRGGVQHVLAALVALAVVLVGGAVAAAPASAAELNSCQYNYDSYYRNMDITVDGTPSITPSPPRYPAPTGTQVDPGQTIHLDGAPIRVSLPSNLPRFGLSAGLLDPGHNTIQAKVWVAVAATNTSQKVQVQGPFIVTATTFIETDPTTEAYVSDTGFTYANPTLADSNWTAVGGDVAFSQAGPGTLPPLPIGPGGALRTPDGSVVIQTTLTGNVSFYMDCQPGVTQDVNPNDDAGPSFLPHTATPFDTTITGPRNVTCISAQGRLVSGPDAYLPDNPSAPLTREIDPIGAKLTAPASPALAGGGAHTLDGAQVRITIPAESVATLADYEDPPGSPLITPGEAYPLDLWVAISGTNSTEGVQVVKVTRTYSLSAAGGSPGWAAFDATIALPAHELARRGGRPDHVLVRAALVDGGDRGDRQCGVRSPRRDREHVV